MAKPRPAAFPQAPQAVTAVPDPCARRDSIAPPRRLIDIGLLQQRLRMPSRPSSPSLHCAAPPASAHTQIKDVDDPALVHMHACNCVPYS